MQTTAGYLEVLDEKTVEIVKAWLQLTRWACQGVVMSLIHWQHWAFVFEGGVVPIYALLQPGIGGQVLPEQLIPCWIKWANGSQSEKATPIR